MFVVAVAVHLLPYVGPLGVLGVDGGAVVCVAEAFTLKDVLRVLSLQLAR